MIIYSPEKKIRLSLREKRISKDLYKNDIENIVQYGIKNDKPRVSIIVVAYNEGDDLIRNLECWKKQDNQDFEIILVDNGLDDNTVSKIKSFDLLHIKTNNNLGCCGGRNAGAVYANADILVFGDADGYNPSDYIGNVLAVMGSGDIVAARGKVEPINPELQKEFMPKQYDLGRKRIISLMDAEGDSAWRTKDYIRAGGFEDSLAGGEGIVLQYRMNEFYGYDRDSFIYDSRMILYHDYHRDDKKLEYKIRQNTIAHRQLRIRYPFMEEFISYYRKKRNYLDGVEDLYSDSVRMKIEKIRNEIESEYESIQNKRKKERHEKPYIIKSGKEHNFSVIVLVNDFDKLFYETMDSIYSQTLENIEIIIVNNNPDIINKEKTFDGLRKYFKIVTPEIDKNNQIYLNDGIDIAKSSYILCLSAGDVINPTYLEKAKNIFDSDEKIGIVSCHSKVSDIDNYLWRPKDRMGLKDSLISTPLHPVSCFTKEMHDLAGGYDKKLSDGNYWEHWINIIKNGSVVRVIPEVLSSYIIRSSTDDVLGGEYDKEAVFYIVNKHRGQYEKNLDTIIARKYQQYKDLQNNQEDENKKTKQQQLAIIQKLKREIRSIKSSKFWKIRNLYVKYKSKLIFGIFHPISFLKKYLWKA